MPAAGTRRPRAGRMALTGESTAMTRSDRILIFVLRIIGASALFALLAVVMPITWMAAVHRWLGLGEMPTDPIVGYLARSLSLFYAFFGIIFLALATDLRRYRPLVRVVGIGAALFGFVLWGVDAAVGLPSWWTLAEGPLTIAFGIGIVVLARGDE